MEYRLLTPDAAVSVIRHLRNRDDLTGPLNVITGDSDGNGPVVLVQHGDEWLLVTEGVPYSNSGD